MSGAAFRQWNIRVGNLFFRHRNALFPVLFALVAVVARPRVLFGRPIVDRLVAQLGVVMALAGQAVRLLTIGYKYIERGGREGRVYASHLVQGDVYALIRNPMYLGNGLIAAGITMVAGAPLLYVVVLPFFLFVYQAIVAAEETYLRARFGADYERYCACVPRWVPSLRRAAAVLAGRPYDWRKAIRKDLSTITGLLTGLILLPVWRAVGFDGWAATAPRLARALAWELAVLAGYGVLVYVKKRRWVFYAERKGAAVGS